MARPERRNVDYFPFYIKDGRTLFILESKYQCKGTGFFTNLMRFLADKEDHHFCIQEEGDRLYFFTKCHCDEESGLDMIEIMVKTGKLDQELWEYGKILVSQAFLDSVQDAYRKRNNECVTMAELRRRYCSDNRVSGAGNSQASVKPAPETPQEGEKKGKPASKTHKEKKRKEKDIKKGAKIETFNLPSQEIINESSIPKIRTDLNKICDELYESKIFPKAHAFKNTMIKKDKNERTILHTLSRCYLKKIFDKDGGPWAYCIKIINIEDGNFNERDYLKAVPEIKPDF